ncbi:MAG: hypothetical protein ACRC9V_10970 [Aeromonas sp.]
MEEIVSRLPEITVRQQQLTEQMTQRQNRADVAMEQMRETIAARIPLPEARSAAHHLLTKLTDQDDVEAYLHTFEVIANREAWDKSEWVKILAPFLMGEAQQAYYALPAAVTEDYDVLKAEILTRMGLSTVSAAQLFGPMMRTRRYESWQHNYHAWDIYGFFRTDPPHPNWQKGWWRTASDRHYCAGTALHSA